MPAGATSQLLIETLRGFLPDFVCTSDTEALSAAMAANMFLVVKGATKSYNESENLGSVRVMASGTRSVIAARVEDLVEFMAAGSVNSPASITPVRTSGFLKSMTADQLSEFCKKYKLYFGTQGVGDSMYLPVAFSAVEKTFDGADVVGLCLRGLVKKDPRHKTSLERIVTAKKQWQPDAGGCEIMEAAIKLIAA